MKKTWPTGASQVTGVHNWYPGNIELEIPGQILYLVESSSNRFGKKTGFLSHLYLKVIFLPRQARDKHRKTQKKPVLSQRAA
jgi:hypothetical protein